jgi:putative transposase
MSRAVSPSAGRPYGLARVCRAWGAARATVYRRRLPPPTEPPRRPGPIGPMPDADLAAAIRAVLAASPFHGEGHRKVWARLRHAGVRTSKRRVLRLMRAHGLLAPSRGGAPRGPRAHDGTIIPGAVDVIVGHVRRRRLWGRIGSLRSGGFLAHRNQRWSEDEPEILRPGRPGARCPEGSC